MSDYDAFRTDAGAVWLPRDFLVVDGPDALSFLQGQLSQDVDIDNGQTAGDRQLGIGVYFCDRLVEGAAVAEPGRGIGELGRLEQAQVALDCIHAF